MYFVIVEEDICFLFYVDGKSPWVGIGTQAPPNDS